MCRAHRAAMVALAIAGACGSALVALSSPAPAQEAPAPQPAAAASGDDNAACIACHAERTPSIVRQWRGSRHASNDVGCLECHEAAAGEPDAFAHEGKTIAVIVTPNDCGQCHGAEAEEFLASHHARAGEILGSLDNVLGRYVEGIPALNAGCQQCHGSVVAFVRDAAGEVVRDEGGKPVLDPATWPNTGMGRINLDGSRGTCSACHSRHSFSASVARRPENCGKCHMGPDHPQIEIYDESKHGIAYRAHEDEMALDSPSWVVGVDYDQAPTCATCHMSATRSQPVTHDVGRRISWTLRPIVSTHLENWEERRAAMQDVCNACHAPPFTTAFYEQYDRVVGLYNEKFARPAQRVIQTLRQQGILTATDFDEPIEWDFYRLWHHEGRRARMGASMMGPDYTQWHGFFEVAETFYTRFLPEARHLAGENEAARAVLGEIDASPDHAWQRGLDAETRARIDRFYRERYGETPGH